MQISQQRLLNQRLYGRPFESIDAALKALAAVQAQDYPGARWALGLRLEGYRDADIEAAFNAGEILRTHLLRPTWHFVRPADIRWLLMLTAPQVQRINGTMYRKTGLDEATLARSHTVIEAALRGGPPLDRDQLGETLRQAGIDIDGAQRLIYILMHAELEGLICSGPRLGKQFSYALIDERVPPAPPLSREAALAELSRRFFSTRGPATPVDFSKWSGLKISEARQGLEMLGDEISRLQIDGQEMWLIETGLAATDRAPRAHLLPNYDELMSSYADYSHLAGGRGMPPSGDRLYWAYPHLILIDGRVEGMWKRIPGRRSQIVELHPFAPFNPDEGAEVKAAAERMSAFLGIPVELR